MFKCVHQMKVSNTYTTGAEARIPIPGTMDWLMMVLWSTALPWAWGMGWCCESRKGCTLESRVGARRREHGRRRRRRRKGALWQQRLGWLGAAHHLAQQGLRRAQAGECGLDEWRDAVRWLAPQPVDGRKLA